VFFVVISAAIPVAVLTLSLSARLAGIGNFVGTCRKEELVLKRTDYCATQGNSSIEQYPSDKG
jgi:hypothetical protein